MAISEEFKDYLFEQFEGVAPITAKRMFGGLGLFKDNMMFVLVTGERRLFMKVDDETIPLFEAAGSEPFVYTGRGKPIRMSYWTLPESAYDDEEERLEWARHAISAARRSGQSKGNKKKR